MNQERLAKMRARMPIVSRHGASDSKISIPEADVEALLAAMERAWALADEWLIFGGIASGWGSFLKKALTGPPAAPGGEGEPEPDLAKAVAEASVVLYDEQCDGTRPEMEKRLEEHWVRELARYAEATGIWPNEPGGEGEPEGVQEGQQASTAASERRIVADALAEHRERHGAKNDCRADP